MVIELDINFEALFLKMRGYEWHLKAIVWILEDWQLYSSIGDNSDNSFSM